jgi:UDP-N-acetylmuramoyl-tripeptide--D-alanyl-D-alanine ligase
MQVAYDYICNSTSEIEKSVIWYKEKGSDSFSEIAKQMNDFVSENDVVLLKGSNSMELEKIVPMICKVCVKNDEKGGC